MAAALAVGTATSPASGTGFTSTWFALTGLGLGMAMPTMLNAALSALTPERSGSGSALMTTGRQVGATIGIAVLGTALSTVYRSKLALPGVPPGLATLARGSVGTGVQVAQRLHSPQLLGAVHQAYASGVDVMLWICAGIAIASAILAALFLPRQPTGPAGTGETASGGAPAADVASSPAGGGASSPAGGVASSPAASGGAE
jgi:hypothetical protein